MVADKKNNKNNRNVNRRITPHGMLFIGVMVLQRYSHLIVHSEKRKYSCNLGCNMYVTFFSCERERPITISTIVKARLL